MDAVKLMGDIIIQTAERTKDRDSIGCAKLVVFCNAVEDNPFMAGAFHGVGERECVINVGVSGPGVIKRALEEVKGQDFETLCETIKRTAFKVTRVGQLVAQEASKRMNVPLGLSIYLWLQHQKLGIPLRRSFKSWVWKKLAHQEQQQLWRF